MRNDFAIRHLDEEEMVQFLDRELPRRRYAGARAHVRTCWTCQARLTELQSMTAEIVRLDRELATLDADVDSGAWPDFGRRLEMARRELEASAPTRGWSAMPFWTRLALGGAVVVSLGLAYMVIGRWSRPAAPAAAPSPATVRPIGPPPVPPAATGPAVRAAAAGAGPALLAAMGLELRVVEVLHQLGADTGEPVQVSADPAKGIAVTGTGLTREREEQIRGALAALPEVEVRFLQPSAAGARTSSPETSLSFTARRPAFFAALETAAGGSRNLEALANSVLDESEEMMAAAHALHNLALRFPPARRSGMNSAELAVLARIEADHVAAVRTRFRRIEGLLAPLAGSLGSEAGAAEETEAAGLFDSARRVELALNDLFGGADSQRSSFPALAAELGAATRQMDRALEGAQ